MNVFDTKNTLVSTIGVVRQLEDIKCKYKFMAYKCALCSSEVVILQNPNINTLTRPSKCIGGCKAKSNFIPLIASQFTIVAPTQMAVIQEMCYESHERYRSLEVQLNEEQVDTVFIGSEVVITGALKYRADKSSKTYGTSYVPYVETFSVFNHNKSGSLMYKSVDSKKMPEIVPILKGDPNLFKILINSLCPIVYGRDEAKAALLLALFSGFDLLKSRRSNSHILLFGNPGTAKSTLMVAACSASPKGMLVSGVVATQPGMTASVSISMGTIEAGALILSDNGVCCIDEIDKMKNPQAILLESMEQQTVSITKCGAVSSMPARCSIIAAANPIDNVYDRTKSMISNINFTSDLISRFDLIVPFLDDMDVTNNDCEFANNTEASSQSSQWLTKSHDGTIEKIPLPTLKEYIEFTQQHFHPTLSAGASQLIKSFFYEYTTICRGNDQINMQGPARTIESIVRLTLARARAEMLKEATVMHAREIIELFKYTQIDIYEREANVLIVNTNESVSFGVITRKKTENVSALSKPKQMKAFIEFMTNKCEEEDRNEFTRTELKAFGAEIGLKDFEDIIFRLNNDGILLKTVDGYRIVSI